MSRRTVYPVLIGISCSHLLNDVVQSLLPAIYPILKAAFHLDFGQIGLLALTFQVTASLLQPVVGLRTDKRPAPYSLPIGMSVSLIGLILLSVSSSFGSLLLAAALVGIGSAVFHPEASRVARLASGGRHGLAQSIFQVGGGTGTALGPLLAAYIVVPRGQSSIALFSVAAIIGVIVLTGVGRWYAHHLVTAAKSQRVGSQEAVTHARENIALALIVLVLLVFSKNFYTASLNSYYTFFLIEKFQVSVQSAQVHLFLFSGAVAVGTLFGGPIGDRFGRKHVIWFSIVGALPFTMTLPYVNLFWTGVLTVIIGLILASSFPAIVVYAQELIPGKTGTITGLFFGLSFGMGGIGAAALGELADVTSIAFVYQLCSFLPAIGLVALLLPNIRPESSTAPQISRGLSVDAIPLPTSASKQRQIVER